ncbi:efflux RND transporter periplasmic adaptor subunit [Roseomonas marmotae]|uniref:Efflux RND transporter periplasmic adaptor subunit n=2 Tax=Roseomonas marmotae TaxID=2768161 RepID=A0ABS3K6U8_9PROT|nr:efflux RND transporter periplasmic adaptor subunit [Roseomonas marmotae]QTI81043.1 efflux RND transporter periplasmic adaptor subunit [Roseomonas marmotae]
MLAGLIGASLFLPPGRLLAQNGGQQGLPVVTSPASRGPMPLEIAANGNVVAESVVNVRSRVDGQIREVHAQEGQRVKRGQPLFTLDTRMAEAQLAQQEAQLARDRALAARARADATRYASLRGEGFAATQRYEQAQADAASADANVKATEALIAQTRLTIDYATIRAEADGRLGALPVDAGNLVRSSEGTVLATITQMDPIQVQFSVPERWLPEIRDAMASGTPTVTARAPGDHHGPAEGNLTFVDSQVDTTSGTVQLKARFANAENQLWPGQYVNVVLVPRVEPQALSVPVQAVQTGSQGRYVYVVDHEGRARRKSVELRRVVSGRAVLEAEINAGDKVVIEGAQLLTDGARVNERTPPANRPQS